MPEKKTTPQNQSKIDRGAPQKKSTPKKTVVKAQSKEELIAEIKAEVTQELKSEGKIGPKYAGFWIRVLASIVDGIVIGIPVFFIVFVVAMIGIFADGSMMSTSNSEDFFTTMFAEEKATTATIIGTIFALIVEFAYYTLMTGKYGATLGKMAVKIKVVNKEDFSDVSMQTAFFREVIGKLIPSGLPSVPHVVFSGIGYFIAFFWYLWVAIDKKKQAPHDKIADTVVVYKDTINN